jgi:hypothetical protein
MFDFIRSLFKTTKVIHKTVQIVRESRAYEQDLGALPMEEFLPKWADATTFPAAGMCSSLRPAATLPDIEQAESRLGLRLPEELKNLYLRTNGIDREIRDADKPARKVLSIQSLVKPGAQKPPLSSTLREEWLAEGRDSGDPEGLCVFSTSLTSLLPGAPHQFVMPFGDVDTMLSLESDGLGPLGVAVVNAHPHFPIGTILQIENGTATHFNGVRAWLASTTGMMVRFKEQYGRYAK